MDLLATTRLKERLHSPPLSSPTNDTLNSSCELPSSALRVWVGMKQAKHAGRLSRRGVIGGWLFLSRSGHPSTSEPSSRRFALCFSRQKNTDGYRPTHGLHADELTGRLLRPELCTSFVSKSCIIVHYREYDGLEEGRTLVLESFASSRRGLFSFAVHLQDVFLVATPSVKDFVRRLHVHD